MNPFFKHLQFVSLLISLTALVISCNNDISKDEEYELNENGLITQLDSLKKLSPEKLLEQEVSFTVTVNNKALLADYFSSAPPIGRLTIDTEKTQIPTSIAKLDKLEALTLTIGPNDQAIVRAIASFKSLKELHLSLKGVKEIPERIFTIKTLKYLYLSGDVEVISPSLKKLQQLEHFSLSHAKVHELPKFLDELPHLVSLDVDYCPLKTNNALKMDRLTWLSISFMSRPELILSKLTGQNHLENLLVSFCRLSKLPANVLNSRHLTSVILSANDLGRRGESLNLSGMPELVELGLGWNNLNVDYVSRITFPADTKLMSINFGLNDLAEINSNLFKLKRLTELNFDSNGIATVPTGITELRNLKILYLGNNNLRFLPESFHNLLLDSLSLNGNANLNRTIEQAFYIPTLKHLDISSMGLVRLPDEIKALSELSVLDVHGNKLDTLSASMAALKKLKKLNLSVNRFNHIPPVINNLRALRALDLDSNRLIDARIIADSLPMLEYLQLDTNNLIKLPDSLHRAKSLISLHISNNPFKDAHAEMVRVSKISSLNDLDISDLNLSRLPNDFVNLKKLSTLNIDKDTIENAEDILNALPSISSVTGKPVHPNFIDITIIKNWGWRVLLFASGVFFAISSFILYKNEKLYMEVVLKNCWHFLNDTKEEGRNLHSIIIWLREFLGVLFNYNSDGNPFLTVGSFGFVFCINVIVMFSKETPFHDSYFIVNYKTAAHFLPALLAVLFSLTIFFRKKIVYMAIVGPLLFTLAIFPSSVLAWFAFFGSSFICLVYIKLCLWFYLLKERKLLQHISTLLLHLLMFMLFIITSKPSAVHYKMPNAIDVVIKSSAAAIFIISLFAQLIMALLAVYLAAKIFERLIHFILDSEILANRKISVPLGLFLISLSSFLNDKASALLEKLLTIF
nr:hypothetical protein [uncultured Mucilaginibacter sp.]